MVNSGCSNDDETGMKRPILHGGAWLMATLAVVALPAVAVAGELNQPIEEYGHLLAVLGTVAVAYLLAYLLLNWLTRRYGFVTGAPYVLAGIIAVPATGWISDATIETFEPLVALVVGGVALAAGLSFSGARLVDQKGPTVKLALSVSVATVAMVVGVPLLVTMQWSVPVAAGEWMPALLVLGALGLVADGRPVRAIADYLQLDRDVTEQASKIAWLSTGIAVVVFGVAFSVYNPGPTWFDTAADPAIWLVAHLLAGASLGLIGGVLMHVRPDDDRLVTIALGVTFTASTLAYVTTLSIVFVNFVVGVVMINASSEALRVKKMIDEAAGPLYVLLLFVAGTLWTVGLEPWVYMAVLVYLVVRFVGRYLGVVLYRPRLSGLRPEPGLHRALLAPGALTAAMIVDFALGFAVLEMTAMFVAAFVLILIAEEVLSYILARGWLIDIAEVGSSSSAAGGWYGWKGGDDA